MNNTQQVLTDVNSFSSTHKNKILIFSIFLLLIPFLYFAIYKSIQTPNGDFANYYTASKLALEHNFKDIRFYEHYFFQQFIEKYFQNNLGSFIPFPPPTVLPLIPLSIFQPIIAKIIFTFFNLALFIFLIILLRKITKTDWKIIILICLLSGISLWNNFRSGQLYLLLLFSIALSIHLLFKEKIFFAGVVIGLLIPIKYFSVLFVIYFLIQKKLKFVLGAIISSIIVILLGIYFTSIEFNLFFLENILPQHLSGKIQDPFGAVFQSYNTLLNRLFVYEPSLNPNPALNFPSAKIFLKTVLSLLFLSLTIFSIKFFEANENKHKILFGISMLTLFGLVNSPASATYHFILMILPMVFLLPIIKEGYYINHKNFLPFLICTYTLMNMFPFHKLFIFDNNKWFSVLAYTKLFLLTIYFLICIPHKVFMQKFFKITLTIIILISLFVTFISNKTKKYDNAIWAGYDGLIIKNLSIQNDTLFYIRETRACYQNFLNDKLTTLNFPPQRETSRDGIFFLFDSTANSNSEIFVHNVYTKKVFQLTYNDSKDINPVWSSDDKKIYFLSDRGRGIDCTTIYFINFDKTKY